MRFLTTNILAVSLVFIFYASLNITFAADNHIRSFKLDKVSIFETEIPDRMQSLTRTGTRSPRFKPGVRFTDEPVIYPEGISDKALFGYVSIDGEQLHFIADIVKGPDYDVLIIDLNADLNFTNDKVLKFNSDSPRANIPATLGTVIAFDSFQLKGVGITRTIWPILLAYPADVDENISLGLPNSTYGISLLNQDAYRGKVDLDGQPREMLLLQQNYVSTSFDNNASVLIDLEKESTPIRFARIDIGDGKFTEYKASPDGENISIITYNEDMGKIQLKCGDQDLKINSFIIHNSSNKHLIIRDAMIRNNTIELPVGDYAAHSASFISGKYSVSMVQTQQLFNIKVEKDRPFIVDFKTSMIASFDFPVDQKVKGENIYISAYFHNENLGLKLSGIRNMSEIVREIEYGSNNKLVIHEKLDPEVKIFDSSGKVIDQGKMPFG